MEHNNKKLEKTLNCILYELKKITKQLEKNKNIEN